MRAVGVVVWSGGGVGLASHHLQDRFQQTPVSASTTHHKGRDTTTKDQEGRDTAHTN